MTMQNGGHKIFPQNLKVLFTLYSVNDLFPNITYKLDSLNIYFLLKSIFNNLS